MKKICYFINSDWYFDLHWLDRARTTMQSGYKVVILSNFNDSMLFDKLSQEGFECINTGMKERSINPFSFAVDIIGCFKKIKEIKPDLLISITIKCLIIGGIYSRLNRVPAVLNFVGLGRIFNSSSFINRAIKMVVKPCIRWIAGSDEVFLCFEHQFDKKKLLSEINIHTDRAFIINGAGVDCEKFSVLPEPAGQDIVILYASRLIVRKGLPDLVKVIEELKTELNISLKLNVAGINVPDDPDAIPQAAIKKWHDEKIITWLGKSDDIPSLLASSHIVALPSTYPEGVPRILLESFAAGRPSVAYDIDGCRSLITDKYNGILVSSGDIAELKSKLRELILNKELRIRLGTAARKTAMSKYSSQIINDETIRLYDKILNGNDTHVRK
ncbi:glycosyltransferase family 4 protein [Pantoea dispersa]|uniref:glycosyltransferase family 4 protein n=1 Tax=Pantoea dispersa TaxID=59814 RepID=UPI0021CA06A4|nr:glycosyltransferase family 4 protein [Pantoea dispersa]